jgi:hypothetical protein
VLIAGPGDRAATTLKTFHFDRGRDLPEPSVLVAGDAGGSVISLDGAVARVVGRRLSRVIFGGLSWEAIDLSGNHIGVISPERPADGSVPERPSKVDVRARKTGSTEYTFEVSDLVISIAVSADTVALSRCDCNLGERLWVDAYERRGLRIGSKRIGARAPAGGPDAIGIVGRRIIYTRAGAIHAWDPRTRGDKILATAGRPIMNFVVTGHRAIWTERLDSRRFAIKMLEVPTR